jgi:hypothetical protein
VSEGGIRERSHNAFYFLVEAILYNADNKAFKESIAKVVDFMITNTDFNYLRRSRQAGAVVRNIVRREHLFEFSLISFSAIAMAGRDGPALLVDFGRIYNDVKEARRPKITVANRSEPVEAGRFTFATPIALLDLPQQDRELLVDALRESNQF